MINIVIGKNSNLSKILKQNINNIILISSQDDIGKKLDNLDLLSFNCINIIFNNFQMATKLNNLDSPYEYINRSITITSIVLEYIKINNLKINKIIYTSSSSVYGNNIFCTETDLLNPLNLHSSLKIANEKLIEKFSKDNNIDYTIMRIFNMYGEDDNFSIISKIEKYYFNSKILTIVNNGNSIRDFININDVVKIYKKVLDIKNLTILNIGTGRGNSIKNIIDFLYSHNIKIKIKNITREELKTSTSNNSLLLSILDDIEFIKVEDYLLEKILNR